MSKRAKILAVILAVVVLSAIGIIAGVIKPVGIAVAQEEPALEEGTNCPRQGLLARVAKILDIAEEDLANAFKQAQQEMRQEWLDKAIEKAIEWEVFSQQQEAYIEGKLDEAVGEGRITEEQKTEILEQMSGWRRVGPYHMNRWHRHGMRMFGW